MSWIYGYYGRSFQQEAELRPALYRFDAPGIKIRAGGSGKNLLCFDNPSNKDEKVFVLGDPILQQGVCFRYPDTGDWAWLCADETRLSHLDGHWVVVFAGNHVIRAYNDPLGKRSLFIHQNRDAWFIASDISLLKESGRAELDIRRFGAYWHTMFPPNLRRYTPSRESCYKDVQMLFQGSRMILDDAGLSMKHQPFLPAEEKQDLPLLLENMCLLPLLSGRKVCVGLSGGMDIRPLLAILLSSGMPFTAVHFGTEEGEDYRIARKIAEDHNIPFRFISHQEASKGWEMAKDYLFHRGFGFNPASNSLLGYYPILSQEADVFLGGYYGELFRFRFMSAHLTSIFRLKKPDFGSFAAYLFNNPSSFFTKDVNLELHRGFVESLKKELADMPSPQGMPNPLWMNLFYARYSPRSINMPDLSHLDDYLCDFMPFMQKAIVGQHWHYGVVRQLNEGLHRGIIKRKAPDLQNYPLAIAEHSASYLHRPYTLKLRLKLKKGASYNQSRTESFLQSNKTEIMALREVSTVIQDPWLDSRKVGRILDSYYGGDRGQEHALLSFISYALGK